MEASPSAAVAAVISRSTTGDPRSVVAAFDAYCWEEGWMMLVGDRKGKVLDAQVTERMSAIAMQNSNKRCGMKVLELGTFVGYSATRIGRLLEASGAVLTTVERNASYASLARDVLEHAGLLSRVVKVAEYPDSSLALEALRASGESYDLVFLDHHKDDYLRDAQYLHSNGMLRPGCVIVADNVIFPGCPDYLAWVRSSPSLFSSSFVPAELEYTKAGGKWEIYGKKKNDTIPDGIEISVYIGGSSSKSSIWSVFDDDDDDEGEKISDVNATERLAPPQSNKSSAWSVFDDDDDGEDDNKDARAEKWSCACNDEALGTNNNDAYEPGVRPFDPFPNLGREKHLLALCSLKQSSNELDDEFAQRIAACLEEHGVAFLHGIFKKENVLKWGDAALLDLEDAKNELRSQYHVELEQVGLGGSTMPFNFYELAMREARRCDLRKSPRLSQALRDGEVTEHPLVRNVLRRLCSPPPKRAFWSSGNWGRWNFDGAGPGAPPEKMQAEAGAVISMPGAKDQAVHADTPHLFESCHLPPHYVDLFIPAANDDEHGLKLGQTAFFVGTHRLDNSAKALSTKNAMLSRLVRPHLLPGDALLFDTRTLHFGLANQSSHASRPVIYVNYTKEWWHKSRVDKNFERRSLFAANKGAQD